MANSTARPRSRKAKAAKGWTAPFAGFPLSYHPPSGRLYKKIRGQRIYFGYATDWKAALDKFKTEKDDWYAGRRPRAVRGVLTVEQLAERFMASRDRKKASGELSNLTFKAYFGVCKHIIAGLGKNRAVEDLTPEDFELLRAKLAKGVTAVTASSRIDRARVVFNFAEKNNLIAGRVKYGDAFRRPDRKALRQAKAERGTRMYERDEVLSLLDVADTQWRAMILLGLNGGLGNSDIANLRTCHLDLDGGWLDYPRVKTGIPRRVPLWPETVQALREVLATERQPLKAEHANRVFLYNGKPWNYRASLHSEVFTGWLRLATERREKQPKNGQQVKPMIRPGRGYYGLRHVCETIGGASKDQVAVDAVMGHCDHSMASNYRAYVEDDRLRAVTDTIRGWLWPEKAQQAPREGGEA